MMFANLLLVSLLQEEWYKVPDTGVMGQAPIKQNHTKPSQTLWHLYSTCMENIPWSSQAEEYTVKPIGSVREEEGEGGCCVRRLWMLCFGDSCLLVPGGILSNRVEESSSTAVN